MLPTLSPKTAESLVTLALAGLPYEVCGLIYEHDIVVQYPNISCGNKKHSFDMEADICDAKAMWHSHPTGPDYPSEDDLPCIETLLNLGIDIRHIVVTPKSVNEFTARLVD
jgi:proteasome lid subunit RPN8/RPN11